MVLYLPSLVFLGLTIASSIHDPRKVRNGIFLLTAIFLAIPGLLAALLSRLSSLIPNSEISAWAFIGIFLVVFLGVFSLGIMLILNGLTVVRREGRSLGHLLSLILGVGIIGYIVIGIVMAASYRSSGPLPSIFGIFFTLVFPIAWLGYGLLAYLLWSWIYGILAPRIGGAVDAVIVLGAGLRHGNLTPLLRSRVERGIEWARRPGLSNNHPVLVMSGGQGPDEPRAESEAMAEYAENQGFPSALLVVENHSTTTNENLTYSSQILRERGDLTQVAVVTSNFHAFRAALLMRSLNIPGYSVGAPIARYYWPTAMLREYVAVLRDNMRINVVGLVISCLPLVMSLLSL
ncbi:YdcF family protein [Arcanobacterium haemolyticum]|nr:YdcF family protein [Arcanobacterium haemolyticum]